MAMADVIVASFKAIICLELLRVNKNIGTLTYTYMLTEYYRVFRAQADWILILPSATSCETAASLADKNACAAGTVSTHCLLLSFIINQI
jgi:hypothetical protein